MTPQIKLAADTHVAEGQFLHEKLTLRIHDFRRFQAGTQRLPFPKEKDKVLYQGTAVPFSVM